MDRLEYSTPTLKESETVISREQNVRLYDGHQKTSFEGGEIMLTSHRLLWGHREALTLNQICLSLSLKLVIYAEEESSSFSFSRSRKVILYLNEPHSDKNEGPQVRSTFNFIKLSFREGYRTDIVGHINETISLKKWEIVTVPSIKLRTGIVGIERSIQEKQKATKESISVAFQDLSKLMTMAKDMVQLSRLISNKIREKQGNVTEDETVQFKSYLLSLGIDDPVTRDTFSTEDQYFSNLAVQVSEIVKQPLEDAGGLLPLIDAFCRVNRARGLELLSPEDFLASCRQMERHNLYLKLHTFKSGVMVLRLASLSNEHVVNNTLELIEEKGSLSAEELAKLLGISVMLAKERLLTCEEYGVACRDDCIEGLRFYPNLFLKDL
ncbi:vacuolar protein-sorting-associated protein 36 [Agrilus planipennis]|uniref:Vacuolar protein-sorting-associated protein 36 n=1 Tax=Agrilus planipennis TaxID=224129 RepID=A0A7F5R594_AGRPL|nr:vacuolar protein-sorting-associated protein 36 [Agrilus planipennis]